MPFTQAVTPAVTQAPPTVSLPSSTSSGEPRISAALVGPELAKLAAQKREVLHEWPKLPPVPMENFILQPTSVMGHRIFQRTVVPATATVVTIDKRNFKVSGGGSEGTYEPTARFLKRNKVAKFGRVTKPRIKPKYSRMRCVELVAPAATSVRSGERRARRLLAGAASQINTPSTATSVAPTNSESSSAATPAVARQPSNDSAPTPSSSAADTAPPTTVPLVVTQSRVATTSSAQGRTSSLPDLSATVSVPVLPDLPPAETLPLPSRSEVADGLDNFLRTRIARLAERTARGAGARCDRESCPPRTHTTSGRAPTAVTTSCGVQMSTGFSNADRGPVDENLDGSFTRMSLARPDQFSPAPSMLPGNSGPPPAQPLSLLASQVPGPQDARPPTSAELSYLDPDPALASGPPLGADGAVLDMPGVYSSTPVKTPMGLFSSAALAQLGPNERHRVVAEIWAVARQEVQGGRVPTALHPHGRALIDPALACSALEGALSAVVTRDGRAACSNAPYALQLVCVAAAGTPMLFICGWCCDAPHVKRMVLEVVGFVDHLRSLGVCPSDDSDEETVVAAIVDRFLSQRPELVSSLVSVTTQLVPGTYGFYGVRAQPPYGVQLETLVPVTLSAWLLRTWTTPLMDCALEFVLELRGQVLVNKWLEALLLSLDLPLRQLPPREDWGFWPHVQHLLTLLLRDRESVAASLRLGAMPSGDLADCLLSDKFQMSANVLLFVLTPLSEAMRTIANPKDVRYVICSVIDVTNTLMFYIRGRAAVYLQCHTWPLLYQPDGSPVVLAQLGGLVDELISLETRVGVPCGQQIRDAALRLFHDWLLCWRPLLQSDLARVLLLPSVPLQDLATRVDGAFAQAIESRRLKVEFVLRELDVFSDGERELSLRDLWDIRRISVPSGCFALVSAALVACR